jgi:hypothetical protein
MSFRDTRRYWVSTTLAALARAPFQESAGHHQLITAHARASFEMHCFIAAHTFQGVVLARRRAADAEAIRMEMTSGGGAHP